MSQDGLPFHLSSLDFDISLDNVDLLSSQQLALVQFHPDATDDAISKAEIIFWRRRQRDQYLLHVDAVVDIGSLNHQENAIAPKTTTQEDSVTQAGTKDDKGQNGATSALAFADPSDIAIETGKADEESGEKDDTTIVIASNANTLVSRNEAVEPEPSTSTLPIASSASPVIVVKEEPEDDVFPSDNTTRVPTSVQQPSRKGKERERELSREEGEASQEVQQPPIIESRLLNSNNAVQQTGLVEESRNEASQAKAPKGSPDRRNFPAVNANQEGARKRGQYSEERASKKRRRTRSRSDSRDRGQHRESHRGRKSRRSASRDGRRYDRGRNRSRRRSSSYSDYSSYSSSSYSGSSSSYSGSSSSYSSSSRSRSRSRSHRRQRERSHGQRSRGGRAPARIPSPEGSPDRTEMARKYRGQVSQPEMLAPRGRSASRPNGHISPPRPIQNNYGFPNQSGPGPSGGACAAQGPPGQHQQYQQSVPAPGPSNEPKPPISIRGRSLPPQDMHPTRPAPPTGGSIYSSRPQPAKWALPPRPGFTTPSSLTNTGPSLERMGSIYK